MIFKVVTFYILHNISRAGYRRSDHKEDTTTPIPGEHLSTLPRKMTLFPLFHNILLNYINAYYVGDMNIIYRLLTPRDDM